MAGKGRGRGSGIKELCCGESMAWVWLVILAMVLSIFVLVGATGRGRVDMDDPAEIGGGPWWAWMVAVIVTLFVFVVIYMLSMQYAEPVLAYKHYKEEGDVEAGMPLKEKHTGAAS